MSPVKLTPAEIEVLKRRAKKIRREGSATHLQALNIFAVERGYKDWRDLTSRNGSPQ